MLDVMFSDEYDRSKDLNCKYDVCSPRGLSALSGEQFPPTLCGRVGKAAPLLLNKRLNCNQELFLVSLPGYLLHLCNKITLLIMLCIVKRLVWAGDMICKPERIVDSDEEPRELLWLGSRVVLVIRANTPPDISSVVTPPPPHCLYH